MVAVGLGRFRGRRERWAVVVAVGAACLGLVGSACGGGGDGPDRPGATVPDGDGGSTVVGEPGSSTTTSTTAAIDITTKPDTITVEYADAVMDELDRILSDAIREFVAADGPTKGFDDKLNAVYDEPSLENQRSAYGRFAVDGVDEFKNPPGDVATSVMEVLKGAPNCIVLRTTRTFAATLVSPQGSPDQRIYVALSPKSADSDPTELNRTAWSIVFDGDVVEGDDPTTAC